MKPIVLEDIIREKNPKLLKYLPGFVLRYLKRVLHIDEINEFMKIHGDKQRLEFCRVILERFDIKTELVGLENVPATGGCVIVANHPLGGLDAIALMHELGKVRQDFKFLVNDVLMKLDNLKDLFVPVNKHGKNSSGYLDEINRVYTSDQAVLVFPAGLVSRKRKGRIEDLLWRKSFIRKSVENNRNVIPVFINGKNSSFFYGLSRWRERLKIKTNLEMFYLVDEVFKQHGKTISIVAGKAIDANMFSDGEDEAYWAQKVKEHVYTLEKNPLATLK